MSRRQQRVSELLREELSELMREAKDPRLAQGLTTITEVQVAPDLRNATVFVSHLGDQGEVLGVLAALNAAVHHFQRELGHRLDLKHIPAFQFKHDVSLERGARLAALINAVGRGRDPDEL